MANTLEQQITEEGPRNAVVKLTGVLADSDIYEKPAISLNQFTNNENGVVLAGFRVDLLEYSIGQAIEVLLEWNSAIPQQIYNLNRSGKIYAYGYGGFIPDPLRSGYTGAINLRTTGFVPGTIQSFTIILELIKLYKQ